MRNIFIGFLFALVTILLFLNVYIYFKLLSIKPATSINYPVSLATTTPPDTTQIAQNITQIQSDFIEDGTLNLILLGIDRRSKAEYSFRTDIMILVSINTFKNKVLMISAPRDLWYGDQRLNALYITQGFEELSNAFYEISGIKAKRFILTDFEDFSWLIDAIGGVNVNVENDFVDSSYPVDATLEYQTISFNTGPELLTGERALIYARSRKGTNGEGSDWSRMKRQHILLKGMVESAMQPSSIFKNMSVEDAYNIVTIGKMDTNLKLEDAKYLWDLYKDRNKYEFVSLFVDDTYIYNPPMEDYGGAWVLVQRENGYKEFQDKIHKVLNDIPDIESQDNIQTSDTNPEMTFN